MVTFSTILFNSVLADTQLGWMEGTQKRYQQIQKIPQHEFQKGIKRQSLDFLLSRWDKRKIFCIKVISRYSAPVLSRYMNRTHCLHKTFCRTEGERAGETSFTLSSALLHKYKIQVELCGREACMSVSFSSNKHIHQLKTFFRNRISRNY